MYNDVWHCPLTLYPFIQQQKWSYADNSLGCALCWKPTFWMRMVPSDPSTMCKTQFCHGCPGFLQPVPPTNNGNKERWWFEAEALHADKTVLGTSLVCGRITCSVAKPKIYQGSTIVPQQQSTASTTTTTTLQQDIGGFTVILAEPWAFNVVSPKKEQQGPQWRCSKLFGVFWMRNATKSHTRIRINCKCSIHKID